MSFMYKENNKGPRTVLWGTPDKTGAQSDFTPFTTTRCCLKQRKESIHFCLGKSCSFGLPRVPFVNCCQFMYLVISLLVLRAGYGIWLCQACLSFYFGYLHLRCSGIVWSNKFWGFSMQTWPSRSGDSWENTDWNCLSSMFALTTFWECVELCPPPRGRGTYCFWCGSCWRRR